MSRITATRAALLLYTTLAATGACQSTNTATQSATMNTLTSQEQQDGWKLLFDGKSTAGWRNYKKQTVGPGWTVVDGILIRSGDDAEDLITVDKYRNFELALDWRLAEGANSGIFYRATEDNDNIWQSAPEMQILDNERHPDGKRDVTSAGAVFDLYGVPHDAIHPAGQWNSIRIVANGDHIEHWANGKKVVEYTIGSDDWKARVAASKWKSVPTFAKSPEGYIGLQFHVGVGGHGDKVEFRNIRIKVLP